MSVGAALLALSGGTALLARRVGARSAKETSTTPFRRLEQVLLWSVALACTVVLARAAIAPLTGYDTIFRWDFLARRILALGNFTFYPPLQLGDFRSYFYPDGIPPLVSFAYWWLYAATGKYLPVITCLWVAAQFAS
ncbi:MAG TPA: hypothetical protein VHW24_08420, partial [Bryobacteraceae bacterium]|nr:hypothetical protein [Bryobacteraceae bacterium]